MTKKRMWVLAVLVSGSLSAATVEDEPKIDLAGLSSSDGWIRVNDRPYRISSSVDGLCRPVLPGDYENARKQNPHATAHVTVFVNRVGSEAMNATNPRFPEGSMIVKQKYYSVTAPVRPEDANLYTVMLKRETGYNPSLGDWEFAVVAGNGKHLESRGKISTCMGCHKDQAVSDYVYRTYREVEQNEIDRH